MAVRTDLALEEREIWEENAEVTTRLSGVRARKHMSHGITTHIVDILDRHGAAALHKPQGTYVTMELDEGVLREPAGFRCAAEQLGKYLSRMVPAEGPVLVAGLGNSAVTSDTIGPRTLNHLLVTRHLQKYLPQLRSVSAVAPGVLGVTGLESMEVIKGIADRSRPCCVVAVDALASRSLHRVCSTVQLSDTGIVPGSGVGNHRAALNRHTMGVPVVAVGVPTIVELDTWMGDQLKEPNGKKDSEDKWEKTMVLTPRDIDRRASRLSRLLGYGISLGLHRGVTMEEISCFLE